MPLHGVGGLEQSVRDLVRHLAERGVDVTLIVPPPRRAAATAGRSVRARPHLTLRHVRYLTFPFANRRGTTILDRSTAYLALRRARGTAGRVACDAGEVDMVHGFGASVLGYARRRRRAGAARAQSAGPRGVRRDARRAARR